METPIRAVHLGAIAALEQAVARLRATAVIIDDQAARSNYDLARAMYRERRAREAAFGCGLELFGEPAWDMLLDLYIAQAEGKRVAVSSACIAAVVPATTALRWIASLTRRGFVVESDDASDGRRSFLRLSEKGTEAMELFFQTRTKL